MKELDIAIELAREAGRLQMEKLGCKHDIEFKGEIDIVTDVDKKCERLIVDRLQKEFPTHSILAEEGDDIQKSSSMRWIIDPIDGTVNYNHGYPLFGPSIALEKNGEMILGVVGIPPRKEIFIAERGSGATLNGKKITVSKETNLRRSLLGTGFSYNLKEGEHTDNLGHFTSFLSEVQAVRRNGMAAGALCDVAAGRFDGFWVLYMKPWDVAAGILAIEEAGGIVTTFDNRPVDIYKIEVAASNGLIHKEMLKVLNR